MSSSAKRCRVEEESSTQRQSSSQDDKEVVHDDDNIEQQPVRGRRRLRVMEQLARTMREIQPQSDVHEVVSDYVIQTSEALEMIRDALLRHDSVTETENQSGEDDEEEDDEEEDDEEGEDDEEYDDDSDVVDDECDNLPNESLHASLPEATSEPPSCSRQKSFNITSTTLMVKKKKKK